MTRALSYTPDGARSFEDPDAAIEAPGTTWVWVESDDRTELEAATDRFGIHPLHVEDVVNDVRPKTELLDDYTFFLLKAIRLRPGETTFEEEVGTRPIGVFIGDDWLVTLTTREVDAVTAVWDRVEGDERRALRRGPDFTGYLVIDRVVDEYFDTLDGVETGIETVEDTILDGPDPDTLPALNELRRDLLAVRRVVWPTREAAAVLSRGDSPHVASETEKYYRDVYDHLVQTVDLAETYRDLTSGARDIYLNTLSQSTNEVMKRLTIVATLVLPLTFVAGIYGMNFEVMPELGWQFGYHAALAGMAAIALILVVYFREEAYL